MKIAVTGGAGFIGANYIYYMLENHPEDTLVCLDSLTYAGNMSTLSAAMESDRFRFYKTDIRDRAGVEAVFAAERPDAVVNFAAETHVDRSIETPEVFLQTNILGTQVLMDACLRHGTGRFHQVSTDEVYGDLPLDRPDLFFTETTPLRASSPYSAACKRVQIHSDNERRRPEKNAGAFSLRGVHPRYFDFLPAHNLHRHLPLHLGHLRNGLS